MNIKGWSYYNHAAIPSTEPHENVDISPIRNRTIWKIDGGGALLARWTSEWDRDAETNWYFVIKDTPFDIDALKSKRRYEIRKGNRNFDVRRIDPMEHLDELLNIQIKAFSAYPESYRPTGLNMDNLTRDVEEWEKSNGDVFGTFRRETGELCGYSVLIPRKKEIQFKIEKTDPATEREGVNAATVNGILEYYRDDLENGKYICDGERPMYHETHFQDYLIKYFGFRKAYCKLNIVYRPGVSAAVKVLFPFRKLIMKLDGSSAFHKVNGVLKMEAIAREK